MKVVLEEDVIGRVVLRATPDVYDATPSAPDLVVEASVESIPASRLALAESLVFFGSVSGELRLDAELHPATAELLSRLAKDRWVHPSPVRFAPADIPSGSLDVEVLEGFDSSARAWTTDSTEDLRLTLLPAEQFSGHLASLRSRWVPTNAHLVGRSNDPLQDLWHRRLGVLLLLSSELEARQFVIPHEWTTATRDFPTYVQLLRTVGLSLTIESLKESE